jgi:hypothetical protein
MRAKSLIIPLVVLLAAAVPLLGIVGHLTEWQEKQPNQKTDDAYLRADMTPLTATDRAAQVLGLQIRQQASTPAISDSFLLIARCCVACLVVASFMSQVLTEHWQVTAAPVGAKGEAHSMKEDRL